MNETNNKNMNAIQPRMLAAEAMPIENAGPSMIEIIAGVIRRWYVVLPVFIVIAGIAVPAVLFLVNAKYTIQGFIRVASVQKSIVTGEADRSGIGQLDSFMNSEARSIMQEDIVRKVVDKLADKNLKFLKEGPFDPINFLKDKLRGEKIVLTPEQILNKAIADGIITAAPAKKTEYIIVSMTSENESEAKQIIDAFVDSYMDIKVVASLQKEENEIKVLEDEKSAIAEKIKDYREQSMLLAKEYGSKDLTPRQEMKLERVSMLYGEVTKYEASVLQLEAKVKVLKKRIEVLESAEGAVDPNEAKYVADVDDPARTEYINADTTVNSLTSEVALYKRQLMEAALNFNPDHPVYKQKKDLLVQYQAEVDKRKEEVGKVYDSMKERQFLWKGKQELINARADLENAEAELELNKNTKLQFELLLKNEDIETRDVGKIQLAIQEKEDLLKLEEEQYVQISRSIRNKQMDRKRPARITKEGNAFVASKQDKRVKLSLAAIFGGFAAGVALAFLLTRADRRLHKPADVSRSIDIRVIGTTTSMGSVKKSLMPSRIAEDFQTIRANLSILNGNGGIAPGRLVITSPGKGEGKTTLAINLATSMAKSGKRVLLIDGDMRSPRIASILGLPKGSRGLQDMLFGMEFQKAVCSMPSTGLDVLASDDHNSADAFELITSPLTSQYIDAVSKKYDHVIIDTPPLLAFPDAMIWAKMSDAVVLSCFIGRTTTQQMKLAKDRLSMVGINLLGTILSNVPSDDGFYQYGYGNYGKTVSSRDAESLFIHMHKEDDEKIEAMGFTD